jgi:hypothetical protein
MRCAEERAVLLGLLERDSDGTLTITYNMKAIADYDTTPGSFVSQEHAAAAIETATGFVDCIRRILTPSPRGRTL